MNLYGEILKKLEGTPCLALERSFVGEEGNLADMRCELREGAEASEIGKEAMTQGQPVCGRAGSSWNVAEPFFPKERLIILGGGHVALPVAEFGARVGFLVTVVDDRLSFANPGRFPMAEKVICDDFGHAIKELKIQESDYICIVTRGHRHDADCLRMIGKGKEPAYLGMIGSRRRVGIVKQELLEEGYDPERMSRLKSPIGLKIGGVTPEEIAISILAEIIQVKRMDREDKRVKTLRRGKKDPVRTRDPSPPTGNTILSTPGPTRTSAELIKSRHIPLPARICCMYAALWRCGRCRRI